MAKHDEDDGKAWWHKEPEDGAAPKADKAPLPAPRSEAEPEQEEPRVHSRALPYLLVVMIATAVVYFMTAEGEQAPEPPPAPTTSAVPAKPKARPKTTIPEAQEIIGAFVADLGARNYESAYRRMASAYRQAHPLASFREAVAANPHLASATEVKIHGSTVSLGTSVDNGVLVTGRGNVNAVFHTLRDGNQWRIITVVVAGVPTLGVNVTAPASEPINDAGLED